MLISGLGGLGDFVFWDYAVEYGIFSEVTGELIGLRDDAPKEAKKSWAEAKKIFDEIAKHDNNAIKNPH